MKTRNTKHTERRKNRKIAAVVAALLVVVMSVTSVAYAANGGSLIDAVASLFGIETQAADAGQWASDPDTHDDWYSGEDGISTGDNSGDSTRNTGRIWTDKSVYTENVRLSSASGETTFEIENDQGTALVGLSALSSAANISGQTTINRPLDIVLVLDVSGSMDDQLVSYSYDTTYNVNENGRTTYYVQNEDGSYTEVDRITGWRGQFDHWEVNGQTVEPMRGSWDTGSGRIQFYTRQATSTGVSKMDALKSAVNGFISATGTENAEISNTANQHRISLVKFAGDNMRYAIGDNTYQDGWNDYNYTQVVSDFSTDTTALTNAVNGLDAAGATAADYGFELANDVMEGGYHSGNAWGNYATYTGARDNAQKVVIFFTDGEPNHGNGFDGSVAADAIDSAYTLKQGGTTVYSIGVMSGANPSDTTTDFNRYMNAVSSNYPSAQANGSWNSLQLGDRVSENDQYYYAADSSESLNSIFEAIRDSFGSGATSPIESNDNIGGEPVGYLTFTDTLGDYTEVKNFKSIVFAGQEFTQVSSTPSDDGTSTTYTFEGRVDNGTGEGIVYPGEHNLSDIEITVTHGATTQQGDTVTVRIPSTMIPMRLYTAESNTVDGETTTETSVLPAYPIRVYYTVGMKANLVDASGNLDASQIDSNYIANHTDADGNVYFYSNDYDGNGVGTTTASFTPATTNSFYYFTQDTPLYTSESTDNPARDYNPGSTYYYQRTYYANDAMHTEWVSFMAAEGQEGNYVQYNQDTNSYYIEQGSPRLTRATEFEAVKDQNITETATDSIKPAWNGTQVIVTLGNNGKIAYPISGDLQIAKTVDWGTTGAEHNDKDFTYTVDLGGTDTAIEGSFDYIKYNAQGQPVDANGDPQQVAEGAEPAATGQISDGDTLTLKNNEHVVITGLPANTAFTVTEDTEAGYTASNTVDGNASDNGAVATGTIASNNTIEVAYTNTYAVTPVDLADGSIHGSKILTGRDWKDGESFTFTLSAVTPNAPLPENTSVTLTNTDQTNYAENDEVAFDFGAIQYTAAGRYIYTVQETEGTEYGLTYSNAVYRITVNVTDDGAGNLTANIESMYRTFNDDGTLTGQDESQWPSIDDRKAVFTNNFLGNDVGIANITGTKAFTDYTSGSTLDINDFQFTITAVTPGAPMPAETQVGNSGTGGVTFADIQFGIDDIGNTYEYDISEVIPADATDNGDGTSTLNGMTYDNTVKRVSIAITQDQSTGNVVATVTGNGFQFTNSYRASSATTEGAADGLQITKQLDGAAGAEGQFEFTMVAANDATRNAITNGWITGIDADGNVKTSPTIVKDGSADILFDNLTFTHPGTYTFNVTETKNAPNTAWTYDDHTYQVTFVVTDENGQLVIADPVTTNGLATFTNSYEASMNYDNEAGGILFSKTLNGRALTANQFNFTVTTLEGDTASADKLAEATTTLSNRYGAADGAAALWRGIAGLTFDQDDADQTYTFIVSETNDGAAGYTYDDKPVTIQIAVSDDGDGSMSTVTTVTKQDGQSVVYNSEDLVRDDASTYPTAAFVNSYDAADADPVSVNFEKQLTGRDWKDTDNFEFTLTPNADRSQGVTSEELASAMPDDTTAAVSGADADKVFSFGDFTFTKVGTYAYNVVETQPAAGTDTAGVTYDTRTAVVIFTVTDPGTGKLQVNTHITDVPLNNDTGAGVFVNTYEYTPATLEQNTDTGIGVQKTVTGAPNAEDFTFTATFNADDPQNTGSIDNIEGLADGKLTAAISDDFAAGDTKITDFGTVTFNAPGVYVFDVTEDNNTTADGWTYDDTTKTVTVKVTDDGEGALEADVIYDNDVEGAADGDKNVTDAAAFTNSYKASSVIIGEGDVAGINVQKTLTGRDWLEGDSFTFTLTAQDGAPMPAEGGDTTSITNGNNPKTAAFGSIEFDAEGEYKYTVKEIRPEEGALGGVTYDTHETTVTVSVTDTDHDGKLEAMVSYDNGSATTDEDQDVTNAAAFTNTYAASSTTLSGTQNLKVEKELTGRDWIASDSFTFTLAGADDITNNAINNGTVVLPDPAEITISGNTGDHAAAFGDITFTEKGSYTFTVTESGDVAGVTNDPEYERTIVVNVTDNNDGTLTAEVVAGESENLKFTNTYDPATITLTGDSALKVQKTLRGREWADGEAYSFTIKSTSAPEGVAAEDIPMPGETEINIGKPADGNVNTATFGDMTFSQAGEYVYEITEVIPEAAEENMTYDGYHVTVTIIVAEDQAAGELTAHVTYNNGDQKVDDDNNNNERNNNDDEFVTDAAAFTNVKSVETTYNLEGTKVIEGRDFQKGDAFTFELRAVDKAPLPQDGDGNDVTSVTIDQSNVREDAANTADISFGEITFTEPGQYVYKISEIEPEEADRIEGMTYDTAERSVIIEVTADEQGDMTAEMIEPADGLVWTNTWADDTEPVLSGLTGTKNLTGTAMAEGQFTFLIQPQGNAPMGDSMMAAFNGEVTQNEGGSYTAPISLLNNVTYTGTGDYVYIISEVNDGQRGITYDTTKYRVTVHVEGGNVTTGIESTKDEEITGDTEWTEAEAIVFNNSYTTSLNYNTAGGLSIIKNLKGHDIAADQFGFTVKAADDASREKAGFGEMSRNYVTSASRMNGNGVSTDSMSVFGDIAFTQADAGKTYTYTISETTGGNTDAGYTNDTRTYTVEITTADDGKGSLTVTTQVTSDQGDEATYTYSNKAGTDQPAVVTFDNTYEASGGIGGEGQVSIIAKKELANSTLNGDDFTFTITDEAGKEVASGTNDASGTITFSEIDYTKDSLIADVASGAAVYSQVDDKDTYTYQYTVAETGDMPDGVSQVAASFQIQVTVTDNNDGTLSAAVTYPEGSEDGLVFRNTYGSEAEAQINVAGKKILNVESGDNVPDITHKYRFTITGADEDGNQAPLPGNTTVANDATGSVTFGDIVYTMENVFGNDPVTESVDEVSGETTEATADVHTDDVQTDEAQTDEASGAVSEEADNTADNVRGAERTKTFYYTVTEAGSVAGVTNDPDAKPFTVTVKDNGDGTLSVESSATAGAQFEFVNTYSVDPTDPESPTDPDAEGGVTITKVLEGRDLKEGEFQFTMTGIAGTISEGMSVSGQNDAEGNVVLGGLVFEAPGTYEFNISEVIPDTLLGGVTYDGHIYTALANVKDNGDGTLSVAWTVSNGTETVDQITFTNTYKADAVGNVILQATKKLEGRDLKDGEFTFQLKDENGEVISEAANTVNGSVRFDALSFDKAGTYNYTVSEVKGNDDTITYDDTVYNVTVTVTDDLQGHLVATVTGEGGNELNMTFNNKYTKPAEPQNPDDDGTPKAVQTGDTTPIIPAIIAVLVSLAAIAAVVVIIMRRRRR